MFKYFFGHCMTSACSPRYKQRQESSMFFLLIKMLILLVGLGLWPPCPKANGSNYLYGRCPCGSSAFWGTFWQVVIVKYNSNNNIIINSWKAGSTLKKFPFIGAGLAGVFYCLFLTWWWRLEEHVLPSPPPSLCFAFSVSAAAWPCLVWCSTPSL